MRFVIKPGLIVVEDDRPGNHATLFASPDGMKFAFRGDASSFDDKAKKYAWAFEGPDDRLEDGFVNVIATYVFATADREAVGEVKDGGIVVTEKKVFVVRGEGGKPVGVAGI